MSEPDIDGTKWPVRVPMTIRHATPPPSAQHPRIEPATIPMSPIERDTLIIRLLESFENRLMETLSHSGAVEAKALDRQAAIETRLSDLKIIQANIEHLNSSILNLIALVGNKYDATEGLLAHLDKRFDALAQEMMVDRIAAASRITSKNLGIPKRKKRRGR